MLCGLRIKIDLWLSLIKLRGVCNALNAVAMVRSDPVGLGIVRTGMSHLQVGGVW